MTEDAPILLRVGDENSYKILKLDKNEVSIGSTEKATYSISSQELSQCLIVIRRHDDKWTVTDIVSSNGICVNGHHLVPLSSYILQDGDVVQFGAPTSPRGQRKFEYKFCHSFTVENISQNKRMRELEEKNKELEQQLQKQNLAIEKSNKIKELELKNKELEQQLQNQNLAMEMILQDTQRERASLLAEINESHKEGTEAKRQALQVKDDVLSNFTELMDVTVQCSICTEYFIKATSLNCSHVFCNLCINEWMKIKKLCPNCRTPVTSMTKIPALDKCIDRMVEQFSDEIRGRRKELISQRKADEKRTNDADASVLRAWNAWLSARDRRMEAVAAIMRAVAHVAVVHTRPTTFRRTVALTRTEVMTHVQAMSRSETARRAAALTKITVQTGAQAFTKAKLLTTTKILAGSAALQRALALTKATAITKSKALTKSTIFRSAAALAKLAATSGAKTLSKSAFLRRAAELANVSAHEGSEAFTKSLVGKRAVALTRAVAHTLVEALPRTAAVRRAVVMSKAVITRAVALRRAHTLAKLTELIRTKALRKAVEVKRTAALIKTYAAAGVATLKNAAVYTRSITLAQTEPPSSGRVIRPTAIQSDIFRNAAQLL